MAPDPTVARPDPIPGPWFRDPIVEPLVVALVMKVRDVFRKRPTERPTIQSPLQSPTVVLGNKSWAAGWS